jgi:2-polyprenyl-3-methyl-5-hydroxy-6-metoxy-1,4-benzoquinol methylase
MADVEALKRRLAGLYAGRGVPGWYTALKLRLIPFEEFARHVPKTGTILEVGCGYGYLANYLSLEEPQRRVIGNDTDAPRIEAAKRSIDGRTNISFEAADSRLMPLEGLDGVVIADVLHHIPYPEQEEVLADLYRKLRPGGILVMRETDKKFRLRYFLFNVVLEWLLYLGKEKLRFRRGSEWARILTSIGYEVRERIPNPPLFPYSTATFVCAKATVRRAS